MEPDCHNCPLKSYWAERGEFAPVKSIIRHKADRLVVGDYPSKQAVTYGIPIGGPAGAELLESLGLKELYRQDSYSFSNVIACRYPNDKPKEFLARLKKENRKRLKQGGVPLSTPRTCCAPRLTADLAKHKYIITLGPAAAKAILPGNPSLYGVRGGPTYVEQHSVLPTFHPRDVLFNPLWKDTFKSDIQKAKRFFSDQLKWKDPEVCYGPSVDVLKAFFARLKKLPQNQRIITYDVETDSIEPLTAALRCIGLGTKDEVYIIPFLSVDGETEFYDGEERALMRCLLREFFLDPHLLKVGHNAGYYDRIVIEQHLGVTPKPLLDTILLHKLARSEFPHGLGYIGSVETDVPAWKAGHTATTATTDQELYSYCATDVAVTASILTPLKQQAQQRSQIHLYDVDAQLQTLCVGMHRLGIRIDEGKRKEHEVSLEASRTKWLEKFRGIVGQLNPNSHDQVRVLLFDRWGLPPHDFTSAGEPSTDASTLRFLLGNPSLDERQLAAIEALRQYRKAAKLLGTYIKKLAPGMGVVDSEGIIYPDYNAHGTISGRFSSSNPNFQNIPYHLRGMFVPAPGKVFIGADFDQLELRLAAALSGAGHYLDAFERKEIDPHNLTGQMMLGKQFWEAKGAPTNKMEKGSGDFKKLRDLAKTICFASLYGAAAPKVHEILMRAEDQNGKLLYSHYNLRDVRALHRKWLRAAPEFKEWWEKELNHWRSNGYIEEPVNGRRRYFYEEDFNAIVNFPVQAGGFSIVAQGMLEMVKHLPFNFREKNGLVNQLHDAVLVQVDEANAHSAQEIITQSLTRKVPGISVTFTADASVGYSWAEV